MAAIKKPTREETETPPEQRHVNTGQAKRLAALTGVSANELQGKTIAELSEPLRWKIDPALFSFRKICGQVVKKDPITGVEYPVPFATVYVEDTDCNLISYFPAPWPWGWFFPFFCQREVIGTTKTDQCGKFCVWVPRFDIDWILEWRKKHVCFPIIFKRPSISDLLSHLTPPIAGPWPPIPGPDPGPVRILTTLPPSLIEAVAGTTAGKLAQRVASSQATHSFSAPSQLTDGVLSARAFETELAPPLPPEFQRALAGQTDVTAAKGASATEGVRSAIAMKLGLNPEAKEIAGLDLRRYIGPFFRCFDIIVPEWQIILDVPDITFRVTQDTNGDGTEETIYSEGYFDVRWDAGALPDVTLVASSIAKESRVCNTPVIQCGTVPAILSAGFMPLNLPGYFDPANGYALRPNRPSNDGLTPNPTDLTRPLAQTPFCRTLQLYGCVDLGGAKYYRILQSIDGGTSFSAITGLAWNNYELSTGTPIPITADSIGWYAVEPTHPVTSNPVPRSSLEFPNFVLDWPTPVLAKSLLKIEIGDGSKNHIAYSASVAIQTDNTFPAVLFSRLAWKFATESDSALNLAARNLLVLCPTIHRNILGTPQSIEVVFEAQVSANHLRNAWVGTSGCGGGNVFSPVTDPMNNPSHWHTNVLDNSVTLYQRYGLSSGALEGAYIFGCTACSRAMNPDGADGGNLVPPDWYYDPQCQLYIYSSPSIAVAVANEN
jgi:hypothetical protein